MPVDLDPVYWLNLGRQIGIVVGLGLAIGGPVGILTWKWTQSRAWVIAVSVSAAVVGLLIVGYIYLTVVLCPPEAMCG